MLGPPLPTTVHHKPTATHSDNRTPEYVPSTEYDMRLSSYSQPKPCFPRNLSKQSASQNSMIPSTFTTYPTPLQPRNRLTGIRRQTSTRALVFCDRPRQSSDPRSSTTKAPLHIHAQTTTMVSERQQLQQQNDDISTFRNIPHATSARRPKAPITEKTTQQPHPRAQQATETTSRTTA